MATDAAHTRWWQISELVFGIPLLAAIALQLALPVSIPYGLLAPAVMIAGAALIIAGTALVILARREFARHGQHTDPGHPTSKVMTTGVFSISRNPLYLGIVCFLVGIALAFDLTWVLVLLVPAIAACHHILIAPEEKYLASKFGQEYAMYAASVHRWLGRARESR